MKIYYIPLALVLGFISAVAFCEALLLPDLRASQAQTEKELKEVRAVNTLCTGQLEETRETLKTCVAQTKEALKAGEECITLLYTMPCELIEKVRASVPMPTLDNPAPKATE